MKRIVRKARRARLRGWSVERPSAQAVIYGVMVLTVFLVTLPVIVTILNSLKTNYESAIGVWTLPRTPIWRNWSVGLSGITRNMLNSIVVSLIAAAGVVFFGSLSAYVFVRHRFPGKEAIYLSIIALMIVPGVLSLTPQYLLTLRLGIKNTWWSLLLPYISGGQIGAIFLFRTFLSQQPEELFEAAKIDGAGDFTMYAAVALPLAVPILTLQAVACFSAYYNDFLWPTLVIDQEQKQMLMPLLRALASQFTGISGEQGVSHAMYLLSGIPLIVISVLGLKYFINGDMASGLKL